MNRNLVFALAIVSGALGFGALMANRAAAGPTPPPRYVRLQSISPGIVESGHITITGNVRAGRFYGDGANITNVSATNLLPGTYTGLYTFTNPGNTFFGDGSNLTNVTATDLAPGAYAGVYAFTNIGNLFNGIHTGFFVGDGGALTNLNALTLNGTVPDANLPSNLARLQTTNTVNSVGVAFGVSQGNTGTGGSFAVTNGGSTSAALLVSHANGAANALDVIGNANVSGNLSKGGGSFKIDHPLDPANTYLYHSFVESPDMKNIYDGVAICDSDGRAEVVLPDYFEALNRDFRYQLTCVGGFSNVFIEQEVRNNHFLIGGGRPGLKVSWQVTGTRHDAYANRHRIPNAVPKEGSDRGKYVHPDAFGLPEEMRIGYDVQIGH